MLRVGIIGCGQIAKCRHAPEYAANARCKLVAFFDNDPLRAAALAQQYGGVACGTLEELFAVGVDAVSICTANSDHASGTIFALTHGAHVLCEKPMAISYGQCQSMVETAMGCKKTLALAHNQRYNSSHRKARELLQQGTIGELISFSLTFGHSGPEGWTGQANPWFYDKSRSHFGALADLGVHKLDLLRFLSGNNAASVTARMTTLDKRYPDGSLISVDDNAFFVVALQNGAMGTVRASWTFYGDEDNSTILYGTKGSIRIYDDDNCSLIVTTRDGTKTRLNLDVMHTNDEQTSGRGDNSGVIDAFVATVLDGTPNPCDGSDALHTMQLVFAAQQSALLDKTILIP